MGAISCSASAALCVYHSLGLKPDNRNPLFATVGSMLTTMNDLGPAGSQSAWAVTTRWMQAVLPESAFSNYPSGVREAFIIAIFVFVSCVVARLVIRPAAEEARSKRKFH